MSPRHTLLFYGVLFLWDSYGNLCVLEKKDSLTTISFHAREKSSGIDFAGSQVRGRPHASG